MSSKTYLNVSATRKFFVCAYRLVELCEPVYKSSIIFLFANENYRHKMGTAPFVGHNRWDLLQMVA